MMAIRPRFRFLARIAPPGALRVLEDHRPSNAKAGARDRAPRRRPHLPRCGVRQERPQRCGSRRRARSFGHDHDGAWIDALLALVLDYEPSDAGRALHADPGRVGECLQVADAAIITSPATAMHRKITPLIGRTWSSPPGSFLERVGVVD